MSYIALTIGPIYKTLKDSKKPKELWSASYIFSYIMKQIISNFKDREFVTPYIKDKKVFEDREVGLFHDRFIFKAKDGDLEKLENIISEELSYIANELSLDFYDVKNYLQIHYGKFEVKENPITDIMPYLDTKELFFQISQDSDNKFINAIKDKSNFLLNDKNIVDDLKKLAYNKYFCVVHSDGDKMSKVIEDANNIEETSKNLFEFCLKSNELIKSYGGQTIFAGGDDLLFFAPVVSKKTSETIFDLCDAISEDFENRFKGVATLSFGISINYLKHPLYEALEDSRNLLFAKAKQEPKNNIAFKVTKHSGQTFEAIVHKGSKDTYEKFLKFVSEISKSDDNNNFLHSIHHKIETHKTTLSQIAHNKERLTNFFDNYFNEDEHKKYQEFFKNLIDYIYQVYQDKNIADDKKIDTVYATLRFIKFVKGDKWDI